MAIAFNYLPAYRRASMVAIETVGKKRTIGGTYVPMTVLILGQYLSAKSPTNYVPVRVYSPEDVATVAGRGSEAHRQALKIFARFGGFYENAWYVPIAAAAESVAAYGTVTFSGTATSAGNFYFAIGGILYTVPVAKGDTDDDVAAALVAAITADIDAPFSAAAGAGESANVVTVTCKWSGANGNEIGVVSNPDGISQTNDNPAGIAITPPVSGYLTSGAGVPSVEDAFFDSDDADILGDTWYTLITAPYNDDTNLELYKSLATLRAKPEVKRPFLTMAGFVKKTYAEAIALPATINSPYVHMVWEDRSRAPAFELAADVIGAIAYSASMDPGRPFKTLELDIMANPSTPNRTNPQNDALFRAGMGYCKLTPSGNLILGDLATTYRTTGTGATTEESFDTVSITHRQEKIYSLDQLFSAPPYDRGILGSNDLVTGKDYVIKPNTVIADMHKLIDWWASEGWTKNPETVKASVTAEINALNNSRLDAEFLDDPAQALRIIAIKHAYLY